MSVSFVAAAVSSTRATNDKLKHREHTILQLQRNAVRLQRVNHDQNLTIQQKAAENASIHADNERLNKQLQSKKAEASRVAAVRPVSAGGLGSSSIEPIVGSAGRAPWGFGNSYTPGQCTDGVASWTRVPMGLHNANTWDDYARAWGWTVSSVPRVGAVAETDAGAYGHVAWIIAISGNQVEVREENYYGPFIVDDRWTPVGSWVYIYF